LSAEFWVFYRRLKRFEEVFDNRIMNVVRRHPMGWPWSVVIHLWSDPFMDRFHLCGGSIGDVS
jgi:hypothetical protein